MQLVLSIRLWPWGPSLSLHQEHLSVQSGQASKALPFSRVLADLHPHPRQQFLSVSDSPCMQEARKESISKFEAEWYGKSLERMGEPRLPDFTKDVNAEVYRLLLLP